MAINHQMRDRILFIIAVILFLVLLYLLYDLFNINLEIEKTKHWMETH